MANQDSLELVKLRNNFYRDSYRRVLATLLIMVIVNIILGIAVLVMVKDKPTPTYFATTSDGKLIRLTPLNLPIVNSAELLQWATLAATSVTTYDFLNYRKELQDASEFFTPQGWKDFQDALRSSRNLETVVNRKLAVKSVATGAPVILDQGVVGGRYKWKVQLPILVTYQSFNTKITQPSEVTMLITRVSTLETPKGIAVDAMFISDQPLRR